MATANQILLSNSGRIFKQPKVISQSKIDKIQAAVAQHESVSSAYDLIDRFLNCFGVETDKKKAVDTLFSMLNECADLKALTAEEISEVEAAKLIASIQSHCKELTDNVSLSAMSEFAELIWALSNKMVSIDLVDFAISGTIDTHNIRINCDEEVYTQRDAYGPEDYIDGEDKAISIKAPTSNSFDRTAVVAYAIRSARVRDVLKFQETMRQSFARKDQEAAVKALVGVTPAATITSNIDRIHALKALAIPGKSQNFQIRVSADERQLDLGKVTVEIIIAHHTMIKTEAKAAVVTASLMKYVNADSEKIAA